MEQLASSLGSHNTRWTVGSTRPSMHAARNAQHSIAAGWRPLLGPRRPSSSRATPESLQDATDATAAEEVPQPTPPKRPAAMSALQQSKEYSWFSSRLPEGEVGRFR
jgi:hypothetical protein